MGLESSPPVVSGQSALGPEERARYACRMALEFEEKGEYVRAEAALGEFWRGVGTEPQVSNLNAPVQADIFLRAGSITRRVSQSSHTADVQESAKDLITKSLQIYGRLGLEEKAGEAQSELAYCYWRKGENDNALVLLREAITKLPDSDTKAEAILRTAVIEKCAGRIRLALDILSENAALFERSPSHVLKGRFHFERGTFLKNLGEAEEEEDLTDRALIDYAAASYHFTEGGHERNLGLVENQTGFLLLKRKRLHAAHAHLSRARVIFAGLNDHFRAAQVDDTRARAFIEQGQYHEAVKAASAAVRVLESGDTHALLAEALCTLGTAQAGGGDYARAHLSFRRAVEVSKLTDDAHLIVRSIIAAITELHGGGRLVELIVLYAEADELLTYTGDAGLAGRLHACAGAIVKALGRGRGADDSNATGAIRRTHPQGVKMSWDGFSLTRTIRRIEAEYIRRALKETSGSVSKAAVLLGYKHPESLNSRINKLGLQSHRVPAKPRMRSLITKGSERKRSE
jgi:tetratricopeptide (TPR) repeat protein